MLSHKAKRELKIDQRQVLIDSLEIGLASPHQILMWGERQLPNGKQVGLVQNAKTVNYKKFTPFPDGLFCERIFGPVTSFVCACGKKQAKSELTFCEKCEVEYIDQRARRYRLGYIGLLSPVTHVWYLKGRPSYLSLFLGKRKKAVVEVAYCNAFFVEHGIKTREDNTKTDSLRNKQFQASIQSRLAINSVLCRPKKGKIFARNVKILRIKSNCKSCSTKTSFYDSDVLIKRRSSCIQLPAFTPTNLPSTISRKKSQQHSHSLPTRPFFQPSSTFTVYNPFFYKTQQTNSIRGCKNIGENRTALKQLLKTQTKSFKNFSASKQLTDPNFVEQGRKLQRFTLPKWGFGGGVICSKNGCLAGNAAIGDVFVLRGKNQSNAFFVNKKNLCTSNTTQSEQLAVSIPLQKKKHSQLLGSQKQNLFYKKRGCFKKSETSVQTFGEFANNVNSKTGLLACEKQLYTRQQTLPFLPTLVCDFAMRDSLIELFHSVSTSEDIPLLPYCRLKRWLPLRNVHRFMAEKSVEPFLKTETNHKKQALNNLCHQGVSTLFHENFGTTHFSNKTMKGEKVFYPFQIEKPRILHLTLFNTNSFLDKILLQQQDSIGKNNAYNITTGKLGNVPNSADKRYSVQTNVVKPAFAPQQRFLLHPSQIENKSSALKNVFPVADFSKNVEFGFLRRNYFSRTTITSRPLMFFNRSNRFALRNDFLVSNWKSTRASLHAATNWSFGALSKANVLRSRQDTVNQAQTRPFYYNQSKSSYLEKKSGLINQKLGLEKDENHQNNQESVEEYDTIRPGPWLEGTAIREILSYTGGGALRQLLQRFNTHSLEKFISAEIEISRYYHKKKAKFAFDLELDFDPELYLDERLRKERDYWPSTEKLSPSITDVETDTYLNRMESAESKDLASTGNLEIALKEKAKMFQRGAEAATPSKRYQNRVFTKTVPKSERLSNVNQNGALFHPFSEQNVSFRESNLPYKSFAFEQADYFPGALKLCSKHIDHRCVLVASRRISKNSRRLKVVKLFTRNHRRPEWMVLSFLPVLPPDLRPILQMSENMVVASDLNNLYQRVIYRNNRHYRLRLIDFSLVTSIQRLVQDAVDRLIENGKGGSKPYYTPNGRPLKSLSDTLKGKKGRFRLNLLGKRVDFSGRSVIVVSPGCKIHECGLPKDIALELYQYFLIRELMLKRHCSSIVVAKQMIKQQGSLVWNILRELVYNHPVLLNRAPTLHRLGIQAFQPKLVLGNAILLHPLVCSAFNADFDGDQMGIHLPLSFSARAESWDLLWSRNNLLSPATGQPILVPSQDMVLGFYYITAFYSSFYNSFSLSDPLKIDIQKNKQNSAGKQNVSEKHLFYTSDEILACFQNNKICLHTPLWLKWNSKIESDETSQTPLEVRINSLALNKHIYLKQKHSSEFTKTQFLDLKNNAFFFNNKSCCFTTLKPDNGKSLFALAKQKPQIQTESLALSNLKNSFSNHLEEKKKIYYVRTTVGRVLVNTIFQ